MHRRIKASTDKVFADIHRQKSSPRGAMLFSQEAPEASKGPRGLLALGGVKRLNKVTAAFQNELGDSFWGCCAAQREQARSPQGMYEPPDP